MKVVWATISLLHMGIESGICTGQGRWCQKLGQIIAVGGRQSVAASWRGEPPRPAAGGEKCVGDDKVVEYGHRILHLPSS